MPPETLTTTEGTISNEEFQEDQIRKDPPNSIKQPLNYVNIFFICSAHLIFVYNVLTFPFTEKYHVVLGSSLFGLFAGLGVTAGAHRLFTHRSYKAKFPLKILLLIAYAMSGHNSLYDWVRDHRTHHKYVETDADPHNSNRGFFFSHVGWLFMKKHPEVIAKGQNIDMSDMSGDPLLVWYNRHFILLKALFCFIVPITALHYILDADWYTCILSEWFGRYLILLNITWCVNSVAHMFGSKPYNKAGNSKDNDALGFFAMGEGWHNYHHAFPWDYRASEFGRVNFTTTCLNLFGKIGWAYDFKFASNELIKNVAEKLGDGSHEKYGHIEIEEPEKMQ